ncbi:von Willebrand factor type A domain protein [Pseudoruegeria aquimaris]|uniref:von Willebrand factor type A domain protein n=1 Tax=Pseudoruegeria aquimaris TaxID=393663 RepID=A0A1Y5SCI9_9RHOB|nr:VWA domain-containing protein [Pseudoruegeria aquimaris]SLN37614.1 von Willebrand factor type A domain protein [Pseudoruegeria aquimaris]
MIELLFPWALIALPLPWFWRRFMPPHREQVPAIRVPFFGDLAEAAGAKVGEGSVVLQHRRWQLAATWIAWVLIVLALARPVQLGEAIEETRAARDVILAIDISGSMDERDMPDAQGNPQQRLQTVKDVVGEFITAREGDRVALIVFGTKAFLQAPLTEDLQTLRDLLDQTTVGMAGPHTAIGDAIGLSIRTFENSEIEQRLLILLSDGSDTASRMSPINAAEIAAGEGVTIHTVAVGDPDGEGENRVDLATLEDIARRSGGQTFFAGDAETLANIYAEIDALTPRETETLSYRPRTPLAHLFLEAALLVGLAGLAGMLAGQRRRARRAAEPATPPDAEGRPAA